MKRLMLPLKLTTEAIWTAGRVARKVRNRLRGDKSSGATSQGEGGRSQASSLAKDLPSAILPEAQLASLGTEPEGGFATGARVVAIEGASQGARRVPPRGIGRVANSEGGLYEFLFYGDDGVPVLISGVKGDALRSL